MKSTLQYLAASLLIGGSVAAHAAEPTIDPATLALMVDGKPYVIRGMNYAPETRGWPGNALTSIGPQGQQHGKGAWLCSGTNEYDPGNWQSACADNDMTGLLASSTADDLYNDALRQQVWAADLGDMQKLGVNTIRLYDVQGGKASSGVQAKSHTEFLDAAMTHGIRVIFPVLTTYANSHPDTIQATVVALMKETCGNPAILAYNVGNELPLSDPQTVSNIQAAIATVRDTCPGALVTYTDNDDISGDQNSWIINGDGKSPVLEALGNQTKRDGTEQEGVDFLMVNEYRNDGNGGLSAYGTFFDQIKNLTNTYHVPFAIGETGEYDNQHFSANWYNGEWAYILQHSSDAHNLGALYFEYTDEPIKKGIAQDPDDNGHQQFMGIVTADWPSATLEEQYDALPASGEPNIRKDGSYIGTPSFTDTNGKTVSFPQSNQNGAGRYTMFSGESVCNYLTGTTWSPNAGACSP